MDMYAKIKELERRVEVLEDLAAGTPPEDEDTGPIPFAPETTEAEAIARVEQEPAPKKRRGKKP